MQIADPRQMTGTKRKLIMRDAASMNSGGMSMSLQDVNMLALRYHLPENEVRGVLVACGYRIPEPDVQPRTDEAPVKKPAAPPAAPPAPPPAAAKPPVPQEVIATILNGSLYKQLGEGDDAFVVTTKAQFLREREAIRKIFEDGGLT